MEFIQQGYQLLLKFIDLFLHLDKHLLEVIQNYGTTTYFFLFLIIFLETGVVVIPFLPGDSLLFAAGAFSATGALQLGWILLLLTIAAIVGDAVNYAIGKFAGKTLIHKGYIKEKHLDKTKKFYEKHGPKTIVLARFVPIVRTIAPFLAGMGEMTYLQFAMYNVVGGIFWVFTCTLAGFFFGNIPIVKQNFSLVVLAIIFISVLPMAWELWKERKEVSHES